MSTFDTAQPTITLPRLVISPTGVHSPEPPSRGLTEDVVIDLNQIVGGILHALKCGSSQLTEHPSLQELEMFGASPALTITQIYELLQDQKLIEIIRSYSSEMISDDLVRRGLQACRQMSLYQFDYNTITWLSQLAGGDAALRQQAMDALRVLSEALETNNVLQGIRQRLGDEPRRDRHNSNCLVIDHRRLHGMLYDTTGLMASQVWTEQDHIDALRTLMDALHKEIYA